MNLGELIANPTKENLSRFDMDYEPFGSYYDDHFSGILFPDYSMYFDYNIFDAANDTKRIHAVILRRWLDTDTYVGLDLFMLDDEPVFTRYQTGRKSIPDWKFVSEEAFYKVRDFFQELINKTKYDIEVPLIDDKFMRLIVEKTDTTSGSISREDIGLSPIGYDKELMKLCHERIDTNTFTKDMHEPVTQLFEEKLISHHNYMATLSGDAYNYAYDESHKTVVEIVELLAKIKDYISR